MPQYMMIYKGQATDMADMSEEESKAVLEKWGDWMGRVGDSLSDVGSPFGPGVSLVDDGSERGAADLTGYSIVEAGSLEDAKKLTEGHPYLSEGKGEYSIEVFELMPVPFDD